MTLYEKIILIYPELDEQILINVGITLQNDNDGQGDYIKEWNHPTLAQPTQEQLDGISA
jgi:hypothetical protein